MTTNRSQGLADGQFDTEEDPDREPLDRQLHNLHVATRELVRADNREEVATVAADTAEDVLGFELNSVRLYDEETGRLHPTAVSQDVETISGERDAYERGESVQFDAFDCGEVLVFQDVREIDDDVPRTGDGSMLVAPIGDHGVITLGTRDDAGITKRHVELAQVFAGNVTVAMDRAERDRRLRERTAELSRQNERLEDFASILSHDLRNPLNTAQGRVTLARERDDPEDLEAASQALDRMEALIDRLLKMTRSGTPVDVNDPVAIEEVARAAWVTVPTAEATLDIESELVVRADRERLRTLFENLFRNAVEHGGTDVTVVVGTLADGDGFYVADDGPGIPEEVGEQVFARGYTTASDGTGFGLSIVKEIVDAHEWTIQLGCCPNPDLPDCGVCFEIVTG
jgi:anti-sigma regulatory factor (Ser/Thr protein kinase)